MSERRLCVSNERNVAVVDSAKSFSVRRPRRHACVFGINRAPYLSRAIIAKYIPTKYKVYMLSIGYTFPLGSVASTAKCLTTDDGDATLENERLEKGQNENRTTFQTLRRTQQRRQEDLMQSLCACVRVCVYSEYSV